MNPAKTISIHVDVDSPIILSRFYGDDSVDYNDGQLELFYRNTFNRAFALFDEFNIKATFFCVGEELLKTPGIANIIREASERGHSIANHTYSHPFGINTLSTVDIIEEIIKCNDIVKSITSIAPVGFRAPGYAIDTKIINTLKEQGIKYDSSSGWPLMNFLFKMMKFINKRGKTRVGYGEANFLFKTEPYIPSYENWKEKDHFKKSSFYEFPLPTSYFLLPFYHNFLLLFPGLIQDVLIAGNTCRHLTYLFHIIEFSSSNDDDIPTAIHKHPHIHTAYAEKIIRHRNLLKKNLKIRTPILTENYINHE